MAIRWFIVNLLVLHFGVWNAVFPARCLWSFIKGSLLVDLLETVASCLSVVDLFQLTWVELQVLRSTDVKRCVLIEPWCEPPAVDIFLRVIWRFCCLGNLLDNGLFLRLSEVLLASVLVDVWELALVLFIERKDSSEKMGRKKLDLWHFIDLQNLLE